jgi:TldD protein
MFDVLRGIISKVPADYVDIRYEKMWETKIVMSKREIYQLGENSGDGYVVRVLKDGGFSSIAFTKLEDADKALKIALENAILISKNSKKKVKLAEVEVVKDIFYSTS